jgi:hypothetical protein
LAALTKENDMGKMNEISLLVHELGWHDASFEELQVHAAKHLLTHVRREPRVQELLPYLGMVDISHAHLVDMVYLTKAQAMNLRHGDLLHHVKHRNRDGTPLRVRVSGKCQTWVTRPAEWRLPVKHGLYGNGAITHANAHEWYVA